MGKLSREHGQTSVTTPRGGPPGSIPITVSIVRQFWPWRHDTAAECAYVIAPRDQVTRQAILLEDFSAADLTRV